MASANPFNQQKPITGVKHILAVASGKGGVGKSSVAANLAVALSQSSYKVGVLDADIYGPSIPRMFGALEQKPSINEHNQIVPIDRHGVRLMSIGFLVEGDAAVVWRGPMLFKAIDQFLRQVDWQGLDYLVVDLPPGTGDVQLSLVQKVPVAGAITVTTPQNVALIDVKKSVEMFERVQVPVLGVVENMASFVPPGQSEPISLFPKGDLDSYLSSKQMRKLVEIPFAQDIAVGAEVGVPYMVSHQKTESARAFQRLAEQTTELLL